MIDYEKLREAWERHCVETGRNHWPSLNALFDDFLTAIESAGGKILWREPTNEMVNLGYGGTDLVDASCTPAKDFGISDEEWEQAQLEEMRVAWKIMWDAAPCLKK